MRKALLVKQLVLITTKNASQRYSRERDQNEDEFTLR